MNGFRAKCSVFAECKASAVFARPCADDALARQRLSGKLEDAANKVERQVEKSAAALLLAHRIGETFDAIVTGAADKGTWVRLFSIPVEGKLVKGFEGQDVGDRVRVQLVSVDVDQGFIDFQRKK